MIKTTQNGFRSTAPRTESTEISNSGISMQNDLISASRQRRCPRPQVTNLQTIQLPQASDIALIEVRQLLIL